MTRFFLIVIFLTISPFTVTSNTCDIRTDNKYGGMKVNCSYKQLASIPRDLPLNTTTLLLSHNQLNAVDNSSFFKLTRLRVLDLSHNKINSIREYSFQPLHHLLVLNLSNNILPLTVSTYKPFTFVGLRSLRVLRMEDNNYDFNKTDGYPDNSFRMLTSLRELYIDGLQNDFGFGFTFLKNLKSLTLSGERRYCRLPFLRNSTFSVFQGLELLNLSNCATEGSQVTVFSHLKHLKVLDMSYNRKLGFAGMANASFGLQNSAIEKILINYVYPKYDVCTHVEESHVKYLTNTKLRELHIDGNGIIGVPAMLFLPRSLEKVSARYNKFQAGLYIMLTPQFKALKYIDVSGINSHGAMPFFKRSAEKPLKRLYLDEPVPVPPQLETLIVSDSSIGGAITPGAIAPNKLKKIVISYNFFTALHGPIGGLETIEHLDVSNNILEIIDSKYFPRNNSLIVLKLDNNFLGNHIAKDFDGSMLFHLNHLKFLNLSRNRIPRIPEAVFKGCISMETLDLSGNSIADFTVDLCKSKNLSQLDLRWNRIQILPSKVREELQHMNDIFLSKNPILCTCESLDFLKWISRNGKIIRDLYAIECKLGERNVRFTDLTKIISDLQKECLMQSSQLVLIISLSASVFLLAILSAGLCYRNRWKLRYLYHAGRSSYRRIVDVGDDDTYQFDAFVSYADPDRWFVFDSLMPELERKAGFRLCIHHRDFLPGDVIATQIVNTIKNSRKTLIILSPSFLNSAWCEYEYNMARQEGVMRRQSVLVVVMLQHVQLKHLPSDLGVMLESNSYLAVNEEQFGSEVFWESLKTSLRTNVGPE